jgi:hypothetical protein
MISVLVKADDKPVAREFFELFKTPWEFFRADSRAEILICSQIEIPETSAKLILIYSGEPTDFDRAQKIKIHSPDLKKFLTLKNFQIPVYGKSVSFDSQNGLCELNFGGQIFIRIGCDLFFEIRELLTRGQPVENAQIPTLDLHIQFLRDLIVSHEIPLVEIPPVPAGHNFIACLTHDCDHIGIRNHKFDHTTFGFLYRATIGSALNFFCGKKTFRQLATNLKAAISLPFVHLGLAKDFWIPFEDYAKVEKNLPSTFFFIPQKNNSGLDVNGNRPAKRAANYDAVDLKENFQELKNSGHEIAVHGIDAWRDVAAGINERERISQLTGANEIGARMHWLFFDEKSFKKLETAGFDYDSTMGYNETVGYRAGTAQVFKPLTAQKILELPLHIMDTALFYPAYLNLSPAQAREKIRPLIENAIERGGVLTVNWHDRSLAPERLWGDFYAALLAWFKEKKAWFATAAQTVAWFKNRREVFFESDSENARIKIKLADAGKKDLPGMRVRVFNPQKTGAGFVELPLQDGMEIFLAA